MMAARTLSELFEIVKVNKGQIGQPEAQVKIESSGQQFTGHIKVDSRTRFGKDWRKT
jgi:hypothetical protein